jgi:hypothetical protein
VKTFRTDTFIEVGTQHKMCEDYIISGGDNYIILADGCSSSSNSEMGARILCYMAKQFLKLYIPQCWSPDIKVAERMGSWVIHNADLLARNLGLNRNCLDATLIVAFYSVGRGAIHVQMFGDGYIILQGEHPQYEIYKVEYLSKDKKSMPFYLRYELDPEGHHLYHESKVTKTIKRLAIYENGTVGSALPEEVAYDQPEEYLFPLEKYNSVSICSDGLGSFLKPVADETGNKIVEIEDIIPSIIQFPNSAGVFLQRRINLVQRQRKKSGENFEHFDDLSMGTFLVEDTKVGEDSTFE